MESQTEENDVEEYENEKFQYEENEQEEIENEEFKDEKDEDRGNMNKGYEYENRNKKNNNSKDISNIYLVNININNGNNNPNHIEKNVNKLFEKIGDMIFNPKYTNRNYAFQIPNKKSSHQRQDKIKNKLLFDNGEEQRNYGEENSEKIKRNKSKKLKRNKCEEINRVNEVYIPPSKIFPLVPILNVIKSICKIITYSPTKIGSGFLINLPSKEKPFYCLITNEHIIEEEMIENGEKITFSYDIEKENRTIKLENRIIKHFNNKKKYVGDRLDATVVQILPEDGIGKEYFLFPNYNYMYNFKNLQSKEITIVQYPFEKYDSLCYSNGKITKIKKYEFTHVASTKLGSSGSPIFLKGTEEVIGIHKSSDERGLNNFGDCIGPIYQHFQSLQTTKKLKTRIFNNDVEVGYNGKYFPTYEIVEGKQKKKVNKSKKIKKESSKKKKLFLKILTFMVKKREMSNQWKLWIILMENFKMNYIMEKKKSKKSHLIP